MARMKDRAPDERRTEHRAPKTLFCQILFEGKQYSGVVLDVSHSGLFVRTAVSPPPGTVVEVTLKLVNGQTWSLQTAIARKPMSGRGDTLTNRGLGLRILEVPDGFSDFVETL